MTTQLIPRALPTALGRGDRNGDRARSETVNAIERACLYLALYRRLRLPGFGGLLELGASASRSLRFYLRREPYSSDCRVVLAYTTDNPTDSARLSITTPYETQRVDLQPTTASGAASSVRVALDAQLGAQADSDEGEVEVEVTLDQVANDSGDYTPKLYIWSVRLQPLPLTTVDL